jgi:hypothetical protein
MRARWRRPSRPPPPLLVLRSKPQEQGFVTCVPLFCDGLDGLPEAAPECIHHEHAHIARCGVGVPVLLCLALPLTRQTADSYLDFFVPFVYTSFLYFHPTTKKKTQLRRAIGWPNVVLFCITAKMPVWLANVLHGSTAISLGSWRERWVNACTRVELACTSQQEVYVCISLCVCVCVQ